MNNLEDIEKEIERQATINVAFKLFTLSEQDLAINDLQELFSCSYRIFLAGYTRAKLAYQHYLDKDGGISHYGDRVYWLQKDYSRMRELVYKKPCKICATCLTRRKPWPEVTTIPENLGKISER